MKNSLLTFILLLLFQLFSCSQEETLQFPEDWIGVYQGTMYIDHIDKGRVDSLSVDFELLPTENEKEWTYKMTYHSDRYGEIIKDYLITQPDSLSANEYYLDEKDGIVIDLSLIGNGLYSNFSVLGSIITSTMRHFGDHIFYELVSCSETNPTVSENITEGEFDDENSSVIEVFSYPPFTTQYVSFIKVSNE